MNTQHIDHRATRLLFTTDRPAPIMAAGQGVYLQDTTGKRYLDFISGWAVTCLGHSHPAISAALEKQAKTLINASPGFLNPAQLAFADRLCELSGFDKVFFCSTGTEANEGAVKLARKYGATRRSGAFKIITMDHGFHGRSLAMMSASGKPGWDSLFEPKVSGFTHVALNDVPALEAAIDPQTVAVMLEPVQGEAGVYEAGRDYLQVVRKICDRHGLLLIFDEVQTGLGRLGSLFAFEQAGVRPDIMTLAKGIGGGYPLAAMLCTTELDIFDKGDQGGTYCGQPLGMAVGLAVVNEIIRLDLASNAERMGRYLCGNLQRLAKCHPLSQPRGRGLLQALDLGDGLQGPAIVAACLERGLILNSPRPGILRFMPALICQESHVDEMCEILDEVLSGM